MRDAIVCSASVVAALKSGIRIIAFAAVLGFGADIAFMDHPNLEAEFVENYEPTSAFGTKALGEPPATSGAPAIRNAVLNATGVEIDTNGVVNVLYALSKPMLLSLPSPSFKAFI